MEEASSIGEVLELAIAREVQAAEFYRAMAERAAIPAMRAFLEQLANDELGHKAILELEMMKEGIVTRSVGKLADLPEADYAAELEVGAEVDFKAALATAIQKERMAFRFYARLAGIVSEELVRDVLLELAEQEARHLVRFEAEYNKLTARDK